MLFPPFILFYELPAAKIRSLFSLSDLQLVRLHNIFALFFYNVFIIAINRAEINMVPLNLRKLKNFIKNI